MLVEDEFLLAMEMESAIRDEGAVVVGPFVTIAQASAAAETEDLAGAVLDLNVRGEMSFPVAAILERRHVPFLFATGYDLSRLPESFRQRPCLRKPFTGHDLARALRNLMQPNGSS